MAVPGNCWEGCLIYVNIRTLARKYIEKKKLGVDIWCTSKFTAWETWILYWSTWFSASCYTSYIASWQLFALEGSRWLKDLGSFNPHRRPRLCPGLQVSTWPSPDYCRHLGNLGSDPIDGRSVFLPFFFLCYSVFSRLMINKMKKKWVILEKMWKNGNHSTVISSIIKLWLWYDNIRRKMRGALRS